MLNYSDDMKLLDFISHLFDMESQLQDFLFKQLKNNINVLYFHRCTAKCLRNYEQINISKVHS